MPKIYLVGGAVRDHLLGIDSQDNDYVAVGADSEYFISRGYKQVGNSFPVFLHPETGDQYALARTERKIGAGYNGFEVVTGKEITLEDDLIRRDLTINAMAMDEDGNIIDPFNGQKDLKDRILRHTSPAFAEDPLRVLRVARFAARYRFFVHPTTLDLCVKLIASGEVATITKDRLWLEIEKILKEADPAYGTWLLSKMVEEAEKVSQRSDVWPLGKLLKTNVDTPARAYYFKNFALRTYLLTNIGVMDNAECNELRVPSYVVRQQQFITAYVEFMNDPSAEGAIRLFDRYRPHIVAEEHRNYTMACKRFQLSDAVNFEAAFDHYCKLDLKEVVDKAKRENKSIEAEVFKAKAEVVSKYFFEKSCQ